MRAIILAAGTGSRMNPLTDTTHKCCLPVAGKPLLHGQVQILSACGIDDIWVVTGYKRHEVMTLGGERLKYLFNPFYKTTNSIVSLWLARHFFTDDILILNCDVIFDALLLKGLLISPRPVSIAVCANWSEDRGYKAEIDESGRVLRMGMDLAKAGAEYAGITCIRKSILPDFTETMERFFDQGRFGDWYEDAVSMMLVDGLPASAVYVSPETWYELDTIEEYEIANARFKEW